MTALRSQLLLIGVSAGTVLVFALAMARGQQPLRQDPERTHSLGDSNLDGKLSLEEFRDLILNGPRLKIAARKAVSPAALEPLFRRMDTDGDGSLTIKEFARLNEIRGAAAGRGPFARKAAGPFMKRALAQKKAAAPGAGGAKAKPAPAAAIDRPVTTEGAKFFETKIRPVLMNKCAKCHSSTADKLKGGLLVDSRDGLRKGGDTGPAVVPGNLDESLLITAIRYTDDSLQMPPNGKLPVAVVADFEEWVKMGAPDPRGQSTAKTASKASVNLAKAREFWSFQPPRKAKPPTVNDAAWPKNNIDRFLLAALEAKGLKPVADAERSTLLRRVSFDLTGLPPAPKELETFLTDSSKDAFKKVVERLLASPRFGERWGRHWLDVARFAESSGKANMLYPNAWRYRDWVIAAFNDDKPFDAFTREQLAGDLLPGGDARRRAELAIATGFLAIGSKTHNTRDRRQFVLDVADEQIDVTSQAFLGLTIACARCHDHKFDPISQRDYYALSGIFQSTQTCYGTLPGIVQNINPSALIELPEMAGAPIAVPNLPPARRRVLEQQLDQLIKERDELTMEGNFTMKGIRTRTVLAILRFRLASFKPDGTPRSYAMGVRERFEPINSPLYTRGELESPAEVVPRGLIQLATETKPSRSTNGSGRLELAEWIASRDNPLTARVMVNRVWLHLFGRGLVATPDNFGASGQAPDHPELLDELAVNFMDQGWSVKKLIREIVLSRAYQLASTHDARNFEVDPDNTLVWRMRKKRLEAEAIRDALLSASARLDLEPPVGSAVALAGEGVAGPNRRFNQDAQNLHRAVYLPVVRDQVSDSLAIFDFADPTLVTGERSSTSGPTQALYLMNNPFVMREAAAAGSLVRLAGDEDEERIKAAYVRFLSRKPTASETTRARDFLARFPAPKDSGDRERTAWTAFCQALYSCAEFRYLD